MNIIAIDIQDENGLQVLSCPVRNQSNLHQNFQENKQNKITLDKSNEIYERDRNEQSLSQKSSQHQDYLPESQSSENTLKYKRYSLRIRDIQIICQNQFYKKGKYSGIHKLKTDAQCQYAQKKEENSRNSPKSGNNILRSKMEESMHPKLKGRKLQAHNYSIKRQKFIFKSDRILASNLYSSKKLQGN